MVIGQPQTIRLPNLPHGQQRRGLTTGRAGHWPAGGHDAIKSGLALGDPAGYALTDAKGFETESRLRRLAVANGVADQQDAGQFEVGDEHLPDAPATGLRHRSGLRADCRFSRKRHLVDERVDTMLPTPAR